MFLYVLLTPFSSLLLFFRNDIRMESKIVAWKNRQEWLNVYDLIYSLSDYETALAILNVWQVRVDKIAWGVVCTGNILSAKVLKQKLEDNSSLAVAYQNTLSSSLTQFIGLAIEKEYKRGQGASMTYLGRDIDIPEEIIELRHACGHGKLPGIAVLEEACEFSFSWLKEKYWEPQKEQYKEVSKKM